MRVRPVDPEQADALGDEPVRADGVDESMQPDEERGNSVRDEPSLAWSGVAQADGTGFAGMLDERLASTGCVARWMTVLLLALGAGPFGVFAALWTGLAGDGGIGSLSILVTAPALEEMTKIALLLWVVERKPWLLPSAGAVVLTGFLSGAVFGAIENVIYLEVYFPDQAQEIAPWRWLATAPMHAIASTIAAIGVARAWRGVMRDRTPARLALAFPWIVTAMVLHGAFNVLAVLLELA
jgi:hypothetical protein